MDGKPLFSLMDKVIYGILAIAIAVGMTVAVNSTISDQTEVLHQLQKLGNQQLAQSRASDCVVSLSLGIAGRDHGEVNGCYADQGLPVPYPNEATD